MQIVGRSSLFECFKRFREGGECIVDDEVNQKASNCSETNKKISALSKSRRTYPRGENVLSGTGLQ